MSSCPKRVYRHRLGSPEPAGQLARPHAFGLLMAAAVFAAACSTIRGFPDPPVTSTAEAPAPGYHLSLSAIKKYNEEENADKKKDIRNEIIDARMAAIDDKYAEFERAIYKEGIEWGLGTDWLVLSLTAATALAGGSVTPKALGAVSTGVVGAQASFDKRALFEKTLIALIAQMRAQRQTIKASIRASEQLPVSGYTWSAAEIDLNSFRDAGSIPGALAAITQDAGKKEATASQTLQDITNGVYQKTAAGLALRSFWKPSGTVDAANEARLTKWMSDNGISTASGMITMFLESGAFESARVKAAKDLGLQK